MSGEKDVSGAEHRDGALPGVQPTLEAAPGGGSELAVGRRLRLGREAKGLSVDDVARMLKLSARQIESLEADDWQRLPCTTIIRGFVRNYARLVNVDPEVLMSELGRASLPEAPELDVPSGTPVRMGDERRADRRDYLRIGAGVSVLTLALGAYFFVPPELVSSSIEALKAVTQSKAEPGDAGGRSKVQGAERPAPAESAAVVPPTIEVLASPAASPASPAVPPAAQPASVAIPEAPVVLPPASASVLRFAFSKPSWVEVRDKSGQIIFSQISPAGTQKEIDGTPPFAVVVGNAAYVTLSYKGQDVDLSKRSGDVARLTLE